MILEDLKSRLGYAIANLFTDPIWNLDIANFIQQSTFLKVPDPNPAYEHNLDVHDGMYFRTRSDRTPGWYQRSLQHPPLEGPGPRNQLSHGYTNPGEIQKLFDSWDL